MYILRVHLKSDNTNQFNFKKNDMQNNNNKTRQMQVRYKDKHNAKIQNKHMQN